VFVQYFPSYVLVAGVQQLSKHDIITTQKQFFFFFLIEKFIQWLKQ